MINEEVQTDGPTVLQVPNARPIKLWTRGVPVEDDARKQLIATARMPFVFSHLAVMPDVHVGKGSTIGSVVPTRGAIIPAAVGVDIGCGMVAVRTELTASDLPDRLTGVRHAIEAAVPHGRLVTKGRRDVGSWDETPAHVDALWKGMEPGFRRIAEKHPAARESQPPRAPRHPWHRQSLHRSVSG